MNSSLRRAARRALEPNAIILGVATCLFGWSLAENLRPRLGDDHLAYRDQEFLCLVSALLLAAVGVATKRALGNLLAATLSGPLPLFIIFSLLMASSLWRVPFFSVEHFEHWLGDLARMTASFWLLTGLSVAILTSATAATLRRTPSRP